MSVSKWTISNTVSDIVRMQ